MHPGELAEDPINGPFAGGAAGQVCPAIAPAPTAPTPGASPTTRPTDRPTARARGARLTWLGTQVGVEALGLEHDEQRAPAQEDCREEEVFHHRRAGHPPAAPVGSGQGGRHDAAARGPGSGSGSAATCAHTSASAPGPGRPVGEAELGRCGSAELATPPRPRPQVRAAKGSPVWPGPGPPTAGPRRRESRSGRAERLLPQLPPR